MKTITALVMAALFASSSCARPFSSVVRRQDNIALTQSTLVESMPLYKAFLTDQGEDESIGYCDRSKYQFGVTVQQKDLLDNTTFRFVLGQPRYGSQGPFLDGNKIFVDHTYNTSQALKDRQSTGGTLAIDTLFFPLYSDAGSADEQKKLRSEPWALSTDNTTEGYVLAGQYAVAAFVFSPSFFTNGSSGGLPSPLVSNVSFSNRDCTQSFLGKSDGAATGLPPSALATVLTVAGMSTAAVALHLL